jgi:NAD(P)-dependent dehydrogenase (short-subunit alcohol dehydrogenase family)
METALQGKKILIIGGGTGIGLEVAKLASRSGASVILASRSIGKQEDAAHNLQGAATEPVDLTDEASISQLFERVGAIDHVAITARQPQKPELFLTADIATIRAAFDVKFWGQYLVAKFAASRIKTGGSITFTSGTASFCAYEGYASVAAMNAATEALARNLAVELAPIRVNTVCPGFADTLPSTPGRYEFSERLALRIPARRLATPTEIAQAYLFLMTNAYSSGTVLVVDGAASC